MTNKTITFADVEKVYKRELDASFKAFKANPSAANYVALQQAMLQYQNFRKN